MNLALLARRADFSPLHPRTVDLSSDLAPTLKRDESRVPSTQEPLVFHTKLPHHPRAFAMRTCVIFNPTARGDRARRFQQQLDRLGDASTLKPTSGPGAARALAREAVEEGNDCVVAAGGDGTLNEVLNGIGDADHGFERVRLGVLPLGTVNVFARELGLPLDLEQAWRTILAGHETRIDLPFAEFMEEGREVRRYFIQLGGAGIDARAVEMVDQSLKRRIGFAAYALAGLRVLNERKPKVRIVAEDLRREAELVLIGNGRYYGGTLTVFPEAQLQDGYFSLRLIQQAGWGFALGCFWGWISGRLGAAGGAEVFKVKSVALESDERVPFELDGEWVGILPARFALRPKALRVCHGG